MGDRPVIAVGAVVVVAAIVLGAMRARNERLDRQREEASELRLEADRRYATAKEAGMAAEEQAQQAHRDRCSRGNGCATRGRGRPGRRELAAPTSPS